MADNRKFLPWFEKRGLFFCTRKPYIVIEIYSCPVAAKNSVEQGCTVLRAGHRHELQPKTSKRNYRKL